MPVTQYIGARYMPIFADPAEHSTAKSYEPLTIVLHEGNSYTSKQYVPVGIEITNEAYWAETGNYNAQVEAYRQEVIRLSNSIASKEFAFETVADMCNTHNLLSAGAICHTNGFHVAGDGGAAYYIISNSGVANGIDVLECSDSLYANLVLTTHNATPEMFGAYGNGLANDTKSFMAMLDSSCDNFNLNSNATYLLDSIVVTKEIVKITGNNSTLKYAPQPSLVSGDQQVMFIEGADYVNSAADKKGIAYIEGVTFDGNWTSQPYADWDASTNTITDCALVFHNYGKVVVKDCVFKNVLSTGINSQNSWSVDISDCVFDHVGMNPWVNNTQGVSNWSCNCINISNGRYGSSGLTDCSHVHVHDCISYYVHDEFIYLAASSNAIIENNTILNYAKQIVEGYPARCLRNLKWVIKDNYYSVDNADSGFLFVGVSSSQSVPSDNITRDIVFENNYVKINSNTARFRLIINRSSSAHSYELDNLTAIFKSNTLIMNQPAFDTSISSSNAAIFRFYCNNVVFVGNKITFPAILNVGSNANKGNIFISNYVDSFVFENNDCDNVHPNVKSTDASFINNVFRKDNQNYPTFYIATIDKEKYGSLYICNNIDSRVVDDHATTFISFRNITDTTVLRSYDNVVISENKIIGAVSSMCDLRHNDFKSLILKDNYAEDANYGVRVLNPGADLPVNISDVFVIVYNVSGNPSFSGFAGSASIVAQPTKMVVEPNI